MVWLRGRVACLAGPFESYINAGLQMAKLVIDAKLFFKHEPIEAPGRSVSLDVILPMETSEPCLILSLDMADGPVLHIYGHDDIETFIAFIKTAATFRDRFFDRAIKSLKLDKMEEES